MSMASVALKKKRNRLQELRNLGFDESTFIPSLYGHSWKVRCSQCEALVINGIPTHESGCPNARKQHGMEEE